MLVSFYLHVTFLSGMSASPAERPLPSPAQQMHVHPQHNFYTCAGLLDYVAADYFWARAVLLLSPTAATLGLAAQIPLACIGDALLGEPVWLASGRATALTAGGALAILCGVFLIHLGDANGRDAAAVEVTEDVVPLLAADT